MGGIERITERLRRQPGLAYRVTGRTITVDPPTDAGFAVSLTEGAGKCVVGFDGWHQHFTSEDEALDCFAFGLSDRCRLRVQYYCGSIPYRWTVEERTADGWQPDSTTGRLFFPFWRRARIEYRQNAVIRTAEQSPTPNGGGR